jgi:outer membrane receptor protein involved in Fe transport
LIVLKIVIEGRDTFQVANVGRAILRGAEFRSITDITDSLSIRADASRVFAEDVLAREPLPMTPPVRGTLSVRVHGNRGCGADRRHLEADLRMVSDQNRSARNESRTPGYALLDLDFGIGFNPKALVDLPMTATVSVKNALNRSYRDHFSSVYWWDAPGRGAVVGLKVII